MQLAIDLGTTNSVAARWTEQGAQLMQLPGLSQPDTGLIPSLLYVTQPTYAGYTVQTQGYDQEQDNRLFRNFKRGIVAQPAPAPRLIDSELWDDRRAGARFAEHIIAMLKHEGEISQLVLTAPVASFEGYFSWLSEVMQPLLPAQSQVQIVDESTAAALGYAVTEPGALVLVFDFGGGTLDLSLVQLPESRARTGGLLGRLRNPGQQAARVIAKAGRILGGSDVDQWLLLDVLRRVHLTPEQLGSGYAALLTHCEQAKIALSATEQVMISFTAAGTAYEVPFSRADLEKLLADNGFLDALRHVIDKVMHTARQRGIFKEDVKHVLLVGGTSLMPAVQETLKAYFTATAVRSDKPFTAVVEGALQLATGQGLDDYLVHSYGLRHLDPQTGQHAYDEIIPAGTAYPTSDAFEVVLAAAHAHQQEIEFVIGEIDTDAVTLVEVKYEDGQAVFVAKASTQAQQIIPLNAETAPLAALRPPGQAGIDRLLASFTIDAQRHLCLTVKDLQTRKPLLSNVRLITLR